MHFVEGTILAFPWTTVGYGKVAGQGTAKTKKSAAKDCLKNVEFFYKIHITILSALVHLAL
jgi:hypothetical protein